MPDVEKTIGEIWTLYGRHQLSRTFDLPELDEWAWDIPRPAPASTCSVTWPASASWTWEPGSAGTPHASPTSAPTSPPSTPPHPAPARPHPLPRHPGLRLVCADAVDHLREADPYDLIYSISGVPFVDPHRLLPALANSLRPGGRLLFSTLHTNSNGDGPSDSVTARPEILRLPGTDIEHQMHMWVLEPQLWEDLLVDHGLVMETVTTIDSPQPDQPLSYRLYAARRPERIRSRPRTSAPPAPHAALGSASSCTARTASCWGATGSAHGKCPADRWSRARRSPRP
ncbi:class I SAM-dependent methyltransferase [Streptomyces sp. C8S0]|uniref:class I SAM-dependent methyltransferase n=1 Tax=Streptomyces sp. C8S0 TaxID=2585716 RepID=UPI001D046860|nr:class I SAM-dependent methyltransferase [Streptomyces sp. C8S0]